MYITKVHAKGSMIALTEKPNKSRLGIIRTPGQRYQVPSVLRAVEQLKDEELKEAAQQLIDSIAAEIGTNGFAVIDWAKPTEEHRTRTREDGTVEQFKTKWGDFELDKLDDALEAIMVENTTPPPPPPPAGRRGGTRKNTPQLDRK